MITGTNNPAPTDLFRLLHAVSEERGLVLAVMEQDVKGHLAPHQVIDGRLHHGVEVSDRERVVQHVVDLRRVNARSIHKK